MSKLKPSLRIQIPPEIEAEMTPAVKAFVLAAFATFESHIIKLQARVQELEEQVRRLTPQNSSLPPSSQHPHAKPTPNRPKSKRKLGGQKGHKRHIRELIPTEQCNAVVPLIPTNCRRCKLQLSGTDEQPLRHQVYELPPIKLIVTEYQQHRLFCPCCKKSTCAPLPDDVPQCQAGPRLVAFTGALMGYFRQSKQRTAVFLEDIFKLPCSASWIVKLQNHVSASLAQPYEEIKTAMHSQAHVHMDESPTKQCNDKAWLWIVSAPLMAIFGIFASRKAEAIEKLLGVGYAGVIHCDRAKMYLSCKQLQWCWAHLKRDFQALIDSPDGKVKRFGHDMMRQLRLTFEIWHLHKSGQISWHSFQCRIAPVRDEVHGLLLRGVYSGNKRLRGMCREIRRHEEWLWTFTRQQGLEPTNNTAERGLRPAVIYRKLSFGTQSVSGSRFLERMLSVVETCRLQDRSVFDYLISATTAHFAKQSSPSLLPDTASS